MEPQGLPMRVGYDPAGKDQSLALQPDGAAPLLRSAALGPTTVPVTGALLGLASAPCPKADGSQWQVFDTVTVPLAVVAPMKAPVPFSTSQAE